MSVFSILKVYFHLQKLFMWFGIWMQTKEKIFTMKSFTNNEINRYIYVASKNENETQLKTN